MQLNSKLSKLAKPRYQQIFKNPQTDILYEKTRPDIIENISIEIGQPKEKLYQYLGIDEPTWLEKLKDKNKITVKEILALAKAAQTSIDIGRPTNRCDFFENISDNDNFNEKLFETIKNLSRKIEKESTEKNKKGLLVRCCGSTVMNSIKDDESIKKNYSLDSSFEALNQYLYAFSFCFEYTPAKENPTITKDMEQELLVNKTIKYLNLVPYNETTTIKTIKEKIKEFIKEEDPSILQLILNTKDKVKEQKLEQLNAEQFIFLMAVNGFSSLDNHQSTTEENGLEALEKAYESISNKISQIPEKIRNKVAEKLQLPYDYLEMQMQPGFPKCSNTDYLIKMSTVTNTSLQFSPEYIAKSKNRYQEEKETAYSIQNEKIKKETTETITKQNVFQLTNSQKPMMETTLNELPIDTLKQFKEKIHKAGEQNEGFFPLLLPFIREYFDINTDETFSINGTKFKIKTKDETEELYMTNNKKADIKKYKDEIISLVTGDTTNFKYIEFNPQKGDKYWTFNIPNDLTPVEKVWGENPYADGISKMLNIIYKKENEISRVNTENIKKLLLS